MKLLLVNDDLDTLRGAGLDPLALDGVGHDGLSDPVDELGHLLGLLLGVVLADLADVGPEGLLRLEDVGVLGLADVGVVGLVLRGEHVARGHVARRDQFVGALS